jgi:DNA-binding Lrp family transcriptional regulator
MSRATSNFYNKSPRDVRGVVTDRDLDLLEYLDRFPYASMEHLADFTGRPYKRLARRVKQLVKDGLIERMAYPVRFYEGGGSFPIMHANTSAAAEILEHRRGFPFKNWDRINKPFTEWPIVDKRAYLRRLPNVEHAILVAKCMAAFTCTESDTLELIEQPAILAGCPEATQKELKPFQWYVPVVHQNVTDIAPVEPDQTFGLHDLEAQRTRFFFLEAETGKEDLYKSDLGDASNYRKFLAYCGTQAEQAHAERFGFRNFRVLFVVPDAGRIGAIHAMLHKYGVPGQSGYNAAQYLFTTFNALQRDRSILDNWVDGKGEAVTLRF